MQEKKSKKKNTHKEFFQGFPTVFNGVGGSSARRRGRVLPFLFPAEFSKPLGSRACYTGSWKKPVNQCFLSAWQSYDIVFAKAKRKKKSSIIARIHIIYEE